MTTTPYRMATGLVLTSAALCAGFATAAPAAAGGIIVIASPSHDNSCLNSYTRTQPYGRTTGTSGSAQGLQAQVPLLGPLNHCGGADLPLDNANQPNIVNTQAGKGNTQFNSNYAPNAAWGTF
ncbi:hypothetical protein ABT247_21150 [Kitasatospora sp. NPDC001539]|uniref:hypothetical protein n=1 Tax=Kitasatospora sp. NPDC001539 TaxID=3154384 RepID=UPI003330D808